MEHLTWIHLSDWHQKGQDFDRDVVRDKLIQDIRSREAIDPRLARINFIIFSGDLANSGKAAEYEAARQNLLDPILEATNLDSKALFIIPGNHDIDTSNFDLLPAELQTPLQDKGTVDAWLSDERKKRRIMEHFEAFTQFVRSYTGQESPDYANIREWMIEGKKISLLGLNSAWMCGRDLKIKDFDVGKTLLGEPQVHKSLDDIAKADIKIAVLHHPFDWLAGFDRDVVERRLYESLNFILCGHNHKGYVQAAHGTYGDCVMIPGGASYDRRIADNPRYTNSYNYVSLNLNTGEGIVFFRRWSEPRIAWIRDEDSITDGRFSFAVSSLRSTSPLPKPSEPKQSKELIPIYKNLAPPKISNPTLIGRNKFIGELKTRLRQKADCALWGPRGIGKEAIARELANEPDLKEVFTDGVLWISLGSAPDVATLLGKWAKELDIATIGEIKTIDQQKEAIHGLLNQRSMLLVIDDVESKEHLTQFLCVHDNSLLGGQGCARLITTAHSDVAKSFGMGVKSVTELTIADALTLFDRIDPRIRQHTPDMVELFVSSAIARWPYVIRIVANALATEIEMQPEGLIDNAIKNILNNKQLLLDVKDNDEESLKKLIQSNLDSLTTNQLNALYAITVFPAYPNTFDIDAINAVCGCDSEDQKNEQPHNVGRLVKFCFLEEVNVYGVFRYAINNIVKTVCDTKANNENRRNFVDYFLDYAEKYSLQEQNIERELENILWALDLADKNGMHSPFFAGVTGLCHFMEKRGLYQTFDDYLLKAEKVADVLNDQQSRSEILWRLGNSALFLREFEKAQRYYEQAKTVAMPVSNSYVLMEINIGLAKVAFKQGQFPAVADLYSNAVKLAKDQLNDQAIMDLYALMGETEDIRGNYSEADKFFEKGCEIALSIRDDERLCCLVSHRGWVSAHQGDFGQAQSYWEEGLDLAKSNKINSDLVFLNANLGWLYDRKGDFERADKYFDEGLTLARQTGYLYGISVLQTNKGAALLHRGLYKEAEQCLNKSREIEERSLDIERKGVTQENLGILESKRGNFPKAKVHFDRGLECAQKGVLERTCAIKTFLGDVYQNLGTREKDPQKKHDYVINAGKSFQEAMNLAEDLKNPERTATVYKHYGIYHDTIGEHEEAEDYLKKALMEASSIGYQWLISSIHNALGNHYLDRNDLPAANKRFLEARKIAEKISSRDMMAAALFGLARCPQTDDEYRMQKQNAVESRKLYWEMGHYKLANVERWINDLPSYS